MSWKKAQLGKLCIIEKGKIGITKAIPGEYPLVVTAEERLTHNEYHFEGNAVVVPLVSSTGHGHKSLKRIHFQSGKFAVGSILCVVMPKDERVLRADYLYRFLDLNREKELVGRMKGMANVTLPMKEIAKIEIPVPPLEEQIEFVNSYKILEGKNSEISTELNHQLDLVKQLRQAFLREAMQGKLVANDPSDEPASELLARIKAEKEQLIKEKRLKKQNSLTPVAEDEISFEIPENWAICRLIDIKDHFKSFSYGVLKPDKSDGEGVRLIKSGDILDFTVKENINSFITESLSNQFKKTLIEGGEILINLVGASIGRIGVAPLSLRGANVSRAVGVLKVNPLIETRFIEFVLYQSIKRLIAEGTLNGSNRPVLNIGTMAEFAIALPPVSEQMRIVAKLDELMKYCDGLEASIQNSRLQNEQLLQQVLREALEPKEDVLV